ncbi:hypothetical protein BN874_2140017 [Candidatus Contendobacter odensis Run_B_J11]|uniref:Transposase IS701-like DDE domain-containing protein n=1 Tax=Candidatus Contendobacter odensis Run_B_J11 TaxID=1400861 RepID=A0A7U7GBG3_9GAMM|nr:hypothetical protein BN874_2140017 [Candidatus Contendobacter odensis Run_B_J11]
MNISHDSVNRFLLREDDTPHDLFNEIRPDLHLKGGTVSVDDSVLDKPYHHLTAFVGHFWSGKHHGVVKGINLITLYYTDPQGQYQPAALSRCKNTTLKINKLNLTSNPLLSQTRC